MIAAVAATRPATPADLPAIVAVARLAPAVGWSPATFAAELARADRRWVVAEVDGVVVGAGGVADLAGDAHVLTVAVVPEARRRGTATRLVRHLVAVAVEELGSARITLEVRRSNAAARALYAGCGFGEAGVRPGYYADGEDAVVLWCDDPGPLVQPPEPTLPVHPPEPTP
jgi:[ribosomal protein S18]-alanine N-acetyltransferase